MSGGEWDHKHGLHGWKRGTDFSTGTSATHGSASLSTKQVKARIYELFGQEGHSEERRLKGIPTHFDQLQGLLKNLISGVGSSTIKTAESELMTHVMTAVQETKINVPPLGLVFPASQNVLIFWKTGGVAGRAGRYVESSELNAAYDHWKVSGATLGAFHKEYPVYKAWSYYKDMAVPAVTAQDAAYTVVGNFFGYGLQWEA